MNTTTMITSQWQVYLPESVREIMGLTVPGQAELEVVEDGVIIRPKKSAVLKLAGKYKDLAKKRKIDLENIRERIDYSNL